MIGSERIFLDTAPIIYFVEHKEEYFEKVFRFFKSHGRSLYFTSVISIAEFFPSPFSSENGNEITDEFNYFVSNMQIRIIDIDREIAEESARIRARYRNFKGMDCLQLAAAKLNCCDLFLTNDKQLRQFSDIHCVILNEV